MYTLQALTLSYTNSSRLFLSLVKASGYMPSVKIQ